MNLAQHWSFVLAFHCAALHSRRLHVTVGSQHSSRSPGRKQKQKKYWLLQQLRKSGRNSIQIGSIERQATKTLFAIVSPKFPDSYLQCIIHVRDCPVIFSSFLVVSCNQGAVKINDTSLRLLLTVDDWGVPSCPDTSNVNESLPFWRPQHADNDNVTADRSVAGALAAEWPSYLYAGDCYQGEKQTGLGRCLIGLEVASYSIIFRAKSWCWRESHKDKRLLGLENLKRLGE